MRTTTLRESLEKTISDINAFLAVPPEDDEDEDEDEDEAMPLDPYTILLMVLLIVGNVLAYSEYLRLVWR